MQISDATRDILTNFAMINPSLIVKSGRSVQTNNSSGLRALAHVDDEFPVDFAVYDLKQFLSFMNLLGNNAEMNFHDDHVSIGDSAEGLIKFFFSSPNVIKTLTPVGTTVNMEEKCTFNLPGETLKKTLKAASSLRNEFISFTSEELIRSFDPENPSGDSFEIETDTMNMTESADFKSVLTVENMKKLMTGDYEVKIDPRGIMSFKRDEKITYYMGLEKEHSEWKKKTD